jgi:hypothetical protein
VGQHGQTSGTVRGFHHARSQLKRTTQAPRRNLIIQWIDLAPFGRERRSWRTVLRVGTALWGGPVGLHLCRVSLASRVFLPQVPRDLLLGTTRTWIRAPREVEMEARGTAWHANEPGSEHGPDPHDLGLR